MIYDITTIVQVLSGTLILFLSILQGLKIKKDISKDLQGMAISIRRR